MNNTDDIKVALEKELAMYDASRESPLKGMLHSAFRGRMLWASVIVWINLLLFSAIAVYAGIAFFTTSDTGEKIFSATLFLTAMVLISVVKLWYWMIANRNAISREIKRVELQIAMLTENLGKNS